MMLNNLAPAAQAPATDNAPVGDAATPAVNAGADAAVNSAANAPDAASLASTFAAWLGRQDVVADATLPVAATDGDGATPAAAAKPSGSTPDDAAPATPDTALLAAMSVPMLPVSALQAAQALQAMMPAQAANSAPAAGAAPAGAAAQAAALQPLAATGDSAAQDSAAQQSAARTPARDASVGADGDSALAEVRRAASTAAAVQENTAADATAATPRGATPAPRENTSEARPSAPAVQDKFQLADSQDAQSGRGAQSGAGNGSANGNGNGNGNGAANDAAGVAAAMLSNVPPAARPSDTLTLAGPPGTWRQNLQEALGDRLHLQVGNNIEQAVIRLEPPQLGRIDIAIRHSAGSLEVNITATNHDVLRQLQTVSDNLRSDLAQRQFSDVAVTVTPAPRGAAAGGAGGAPFGDQAGGRGRGQDRDEADGQQRGPGRALAEANDGTSGFSLGGRD